MKFNTPKGWSVVIICLIALAVMAANPTFQSFNIYRFFIQGSGSAQTVQLQDGVKLIEEYGAIGDGVTDCTAAISNAAASGLHILFTNTAGYVMTNTAYLTNNSYFEFTGSKLIFATGYTNPAANGLLYISNCNNVHIRGLIIDGLRYGFTGNGATCGGASPPLAWGMNNCGTDASNVKQTFNQGTRNGVLFSSCTNSDIINYYADGLSGAALIYNGISGQVTIQPTNNSVLFSGLRFNYCWTGLLVTNAGEYAMFTDIGGTMNGILLNIAEGNTSIRGVNSTRNGEGCRISGGENAAHPYISGAVFNHTAVPVVCLNSASGASFDGCSILGANGTSCLVAITNFAGFQWNGGYFAPLFLSCIAGGNTTSGYNYSTGISTGLIPAGQLTVGANASFNYMTKIISASSLVENLTNYSEAWTYNQNQSFPGGITGNGSGLTNLIATNGAFSAIGVSASVASTMMYTNTTGGYVAMTIHGETEVTTAATTGTLLVQYTWTNQLGQQTFTPLNAISTGVTGTDPFAPTEIVISNTTAVTIKTTLVNTVGTATYSLRSALSRWQ